MIQISNHGRNLVVEITGDIDHHTADEIKNKIDAAFAGVNGKNIVFDFGQVTFMDSSGIGMMIGRYKNAQKQGGQMAVVNMSGDINRIFELSGLPKIVKVFYSVEEALRLK